MSTVALQQKKKKAPFKLFKVPIGQGRGDLYIEAPSRKHLITHYGLPKDLVEKSMNVVRFAYAHETDIKWLPEPYYRRGKLTW